ncbi:MAG: hypothetical protein U9Q74_15360 [Gemmatimonadota bacterium]|nr:hypothetical protein [Gemmatimonadota bacterium]
MLAIAALAAGAFWLGTRTNEALGSGPAVAHADTAAPTVQAQENEIEGQAVGEVIVNERPVIRMRTDAGGFTAAERATIVAERLRDWVSGSFSPYDIKVRQGEYGAAELRAHGNMIVTVNPQEAAALGSTATGLANAWRDNIMLALGVAHANLPEYDTGAETPGTAVAEGGEEVSAAGEGVAEAGEQVAGGEGEQATAAWTPAEQYTDKIVPIISVAEGTKIGVARVNGPRSRVDQVEACAQVETHLRDFLEVDLYVPITTNEPGPGGLNRVQQVGVTALGDIEL